jgi:2-oxoglutarate ferredoxin oxidoreductase subunit alpha
MLNDRGITVNHLPIKWIVPFHASEVTDILSRANRTIIVENNYSGQFARYLRSETGISADAHIRKYDGEPFMPHHVVDGVIELMDKTTDRYIPFQEILV